MNERATVQLFVYGTLMRGEASYELLAGAVLLDVPRTADGYGLVDVGSYPGMIEVESGSVVGELYEVPGSKLPQLDEFEDHPTLFERAEVELWDGRCVQGYLFRMFTGQPRIESGDWRKRE